MLRLDLIKPQDSSVSPSYSSSSSSSSSSVPHVHFNLRSSTNTVSTHTFRGDLTVGYVKLFLCHQQESERDEASVLTPTHITFTLEGKEMFDPMSLTDYPSLKATASSSSEAPAAAALPTIQWTITEDAERLNAEMKNVKIVRSESSEDEED